MVIDPSTTGKYTLYLATVDFIELYSIELFSLRCEDWRDEFRWEAFENLRVSTNSFRHWGRQIQRRVAIAQNLITAL